MTSHHQPKTLHHEVEGTEAGFRQAEQNSSKTHRKMIMVSDCVCVCVYTTLQFTALCLGHYSVGLIGQHFLPIINSENPCGFHKTQVLIFRQSLKEKERGGGKRQASFFIYCNTHTLMSLPLWSLVVIVWMPEGTPWYLPCVLTVSVAYYTLTTRPDCWVTVMNIPNPDVCHV